MGTECFVKALLGVCIEAAPDDATDDGVKVVAVGPAVPAQQPTVFQVGQSSVEGCFIGKGPSVVIATFVNKESS